MGSDFPKLNCGPAVSTRDHNTHLTEMFTLLFLSYLFKCETVERGLRVAPFYLFLNASLPGRLLQLLGGEATCMAPFS